MRGESVLLAVGLGDRYLGGDDEDDDDGVTCMYPTTVALKKSPLFLCQFQGFPMVPHLRIQLHTCCFGSL